MHSHIRNDHGLGNGRKDNVLIGVLEVEIYIDRPEGFVQEGKEHLVCKLKKALYGLKQLLRAWYHCIDSFFINKVFVGAKRIVCCTSNKRVSI